VHYHFKSKDSLLEAIIERRAGPVNAERLERLNTALRTAHGRDQPKMAGRFQAQHRIGAYRKQQPTSRRSATAET